MPHDRGHCCAQTQGSVFLYDGRPAAVLNVFVALSRGFCVRLLSVSDSPSEISELGLSSGAGPEGLAPRLSERAAGSGVRAGLRSGWGPRGRHRQGGHCSRAFGFGLLPPSTTLSPTCHSPRGCQRPQGLPWETWAVLAPPHGPAAAATRFRNFYSFFFVVFYFKLMSEKLQRNTERFGVSLPTDDV